MTRNEIMQDLSRGAIDNLYLDGMISYTCNTIYTKQLEEENLKEQIKRSSKRPEDKFMSSVKVGPKGQIVIPKEVRDMFHINPGDTLLLVADAEKGIAIQHYSVFSQIADAIFAGKAKDIYPENSEEEAMHFAQAIKENNEEKAL